MHYLALLALPEIASIRLCSLLFWHTGGFPARTTCPPIKVTTSPLLSLNLLPRRAGPLPRAILAAIAGGLGLITLPHLDFRSSPTFLFMVGQITGKMFDQSIEKDCVSDLSGPASCRTGKCCYSKFSCSACNRNGQRGEVCFKL